VLVECELLEQQQQGREIYYHLNPERMQEVEQWLHQFKGLLEKRFSQLDEVLAKLKTNKPMKPTPLTHFAVDRDNRKINVEREFSAPLPLVWAAWTESELLDQWWAPKPWQAKPNGWIFRRAATGCTQWSARKEKRTGPGRTSGPFLL
jgi:hypothetical protein